MTPRVLRWLVPLLALALVASACGDDDDEDASATTAEVTTTEAATTTAPAAGPAMTVTPDTGLADGQTVKVEATGFTPGTNLGITQCADLGEETGAGDCDLGSIKPVAADAEGNVSADYAVRAGPFGENQRTCNASQACVLSVGELTADPDAERATATIAFG